MKISFVTLSAMLIAGFGLQASTKTPLQVEHLAQFNQLSDIVLAPGGNQLVFAQKNGGVKPADSSHDLYLMDFSRNNSVQRLTQNSSREHQVRWAADGSAIYFLADRTGSNQVWRLNLAGGEAQQVTDLPLPVQGFQLSADGKLLALALRHKPGCGDIACTLKAQAADAARDDTAMVYDQLMVRHWDRWLDGYRTHLFVASLDTKPVTDARNLMPDWNSDIAGINEVAFTPDQQHLVFSAKMPGVDESWHTNFDIFEVSIEGGEKKNLTADNPAWDSHPSFSPDGRFMAYLAMTTPQAESDRRRLVLLDQVTNQRTVLTEDWDRSIYSYQFGPDNRTIYVTTQDVGQVSIYAINTSFGDVRKVYGDGTAGHLNVAADRIVFSNHRLNQPTEIYQIQPDGSRLQQLTHVNGPLLEGIAFGDFEQFSFAGWEGNTVYGYLVKPVNFDASKRYPLAYLVHGGPQGSFGNMFHYRWNAQLWAAQGYVVVMVDFHGSTGYGQAFTDSISRDWGGKPLVDLQKGFEYVQSAYPWIDGDRACALGASYGGYMMNWFAGKWPDAFRCLVNHAGLYDMPSFYSSTEELFFPEFDLGGTAWDEDSDYAKFNPAAYADNWQTPMLVIHGLKDYRVPYAQGLGAFTNLQRKGIESRLVIFPDENHWIQQPANRVRWYNEVFDWMKRFTAE
ncbi:S9 family peptidase [Alkalimonas delamerensis]|uniref:S9 family peptidase n=1 Tax=Alkalimonas delamerensis TaxID=265981 RepID=A0ABT9GQZ6_9GAMM|nr:S9 family peptidase [Alkalimonas delamerensis]MDP4529403.1 S9 family peptidase [Alkalimonas delamerensis]